MITQAKPHNMNFSVKTEMHDDVSLQSSNTSTSGSSRKSKNIPVELTAFGTTPSGKPRLFVCHVCTRAFARLEHLRRHERSHTKEKPFSCGVCQRKFSRRDLLLRHAQKLHAGCDDAITRLRRKSIKRESRSNDMDLDEEDESQSPESKDENSNQTDPVNFNLNLFDKRNQPLTQKDSRQNSTTSDLGRNPSLKEAAASLQRQVLERKKLLMGRSRGVSFSAQSGPNYAVGGSEFNDMYPGAESIEFSTPQILPSNNEDWIGNLSTVPGAKVKNSITPLSLDDLPQNVSHHGSFSGNMHSHLRSDSINSMNSLNTYESSMHYMMPGDSMHSDTNSNHNPIMSNNLSGLIPEHTSGEDYGYSFYDIPESMLSVVNNEHFKLPTGLTTIEQGIEGTTPPQYQRNKSNNNNNMNKNNNKGYHGNPNLDMNFLNDISELAHEYDVNSKFLPNGYSFYGDNPSVSSSGIETLSPQNVTPGGENTIATGNQLLSIEKNISPSDSQLNKKIKPIGVRPTGNYNRNKLFTNNMRCMINKALGKYPISGIMTPSIPSNEKLEYYLTNFINIFLSHFPFIHISKLNEYEIMSMTSNEDPENESSRVCLPLLVATIGALLTNNKNDSEHLYEASRRTVHIYLESRKNGTFENEDKDNPQSSNPLWLIQSLTLSVIYGLFSDNENNVYIVIRQLNALNSLVKTSIKNNSKILFSIHGDDYETFMKCEKDQGNENGSLFAYDLNDELKFKNSILLQAQRRIVFMIYRLTTFLLMMYNVPLTLSINDLGMLDAPNKSEEYIWGFKNFQQFQQFKQQHNSPGINEILAASAKHKIVFREALLEVTRSFGGEIDNNNIELSNKLNNLSRYGFISVVHGIFEIKQYQEMKSVDVFVLLDNLTKFINNDANNKNEIKLLSLNRVQEDFEILDYLLLANFTKISSLINIKLVKEQSWLKNYDELSKNFNNLLMNVNGISNSDYLKIVDCCLVIIKLILLKKPYTEEPNYNISSALNSSSFERTEGLHQLVTESVASMASGTQISEVEFEKLLHLQVFDDFDNSKSSIHSQMLFHVFVIFSLFTTFMIRKNYFKSKNHIINEFQNQAINEYDHELNQRFEVVMQILGKIEIFLKEKLANLNLQNDMTSFYLYSNNGAFSNNIYSLEKPLYVLKVGELILRYVYDMNIKVSIFQKLSSSMSQLRKFMIDNEGRILA